jgi:hypothetical protein
MSTSVCADAAKIGALVQMSCTTVGQLSMYAELGEECTANSSYPDWETSHIW